MLSLDFQMFFHLHPKVVPRTDLIPFTPARNHRLAPGPGREVARLWTGLRFHRRLRGSPPLRQAPALSDPACSFDQRLVVEKAESGGHGVFNFFSYRWSAPHRTPGSRRTHNRAMPAALGDVSSVCASVRVAPPLSQRRPTPGRGLVLLVVAVIPAAIPRKTPAPFERRWPELDLLPPFLLRPSITAARAVASPAPVLFLPADLHRRLEPVPRGAPFPIAGRRTGAVFDRLVAHSAPLPTHLSFVPAPQVCLRLIRSHLEPRRVVRTHAPESQTPAQPAPRIAGAEAKGDITPRTARRRTSRRCLPLRGFRMGWSTPRRSLRSGEVDGRIGMPRRRNRPPDRDPSRHPRRCVLREAGRLR